MNFSSIYRDQHTNLPITLDEDTARGNTYIVTGANAGLGYECVKHLARFRAERVIMAVRNTKAGNDAARAIEREVASTGQSTRLEVWELDLASFDSVKAFAQRVLKNLDRVDALIENAGVASTSWGEQEDGWNLNMTVNLASTMLLTVLLMPHLRASGKKAGIVPRIAIIGSIVSFTPEGKGCFDKLDKENILSDIIDKEKWKSSVADLYVA